MKLFIAICAGIGFSIIATGVADYKMDKYGRLRGTGLSPTDKMGKLLSVGLVSAIVFAIVTYQALK